MIFFAFFTHGNMFYTHRNVRLCTKKIIFVPNICRIFASNLKKICRNFFAFSIFDWLKALNRSQKSIVKFCHFLCLYMIYIEKKLSAENVCMCVCLSVCVCVSVGKLSIFCHAITRKRLHRSLWNFAWLFGYVFWWTLLILAMICQKLSFLPILVKIRVYLNFLRPNVRENRKQSLMNSGHQILQFELL